MNHVLAIPTWRCNFSCAYCLYKVKGKKAHLFFQQEDHKTVAADGAAPDEWLARLEPLAPFHLEFSGGEPTMYRGLAHLVSSLPRNCTWGLTTNLSNTEMFEERTGVDTCRGVTASYHPDARYPYGDLGYFLSRVRLLRSKGFQAYVNMVVTPGNLEDVPAWISAASGVARVNVLLYVSPGFTWPKELLSKALALATSGKGFNNPEGAASEATRDCRAGHSYFVLMPDLSAYPCYMKAMSVDEEPVELKLREGTSRCDKPCPFSCDHERGLL